MKAWLIDGLTGIDALHLADAPDPSPGAGEVALDVLHTALNPADRYLAEGQYPAKPTFPHILGRDAVGVVRAFGSGVSGINVGDKRLLLRGEAGVNRPGTFAQQVVVPVDNLAPVPEGWSDAQACCAALVYVTAYQALTQWPDLPTKATVLITGASGGVGVAATQLAGLMGHDVIALSRNVEKQGRLKGLGAKAAFDPADDKWGRNLRALPGGAKVDLAIDSVGGALFNGILAVMADRGRISCVGRLAGPVPEFNTASLFFRRLKIGGVTVGGYTHAESHAAWAKVVELMRRTGAKPIVDRVFAFEELPQAFARLAEGPMGKVVVKVNA